MQTPCAAKSANTLGLIRADAEAVFRERSDTPGKFRMLLSLLFNPGFKAVLHYRLANECLRHRGLRLIGSYFSYRARVKYAIEISPSAKMGRSFQGIHGVGVVIGCSCVIGDNCVLYHGVTIGARAVAWMTSIRLSKTELSYLPVPR